MVKKQNATDTRFSSAICVGLADESERASIAEGDVSQKYIYTTEDKLRLAIRDYDESVRSTQDWIAPLGIFLSLIITLVAADFKSSRLGIKADTWEAIFVICSCMTFVWLIKCVVRRLTSKRINNVNDLIAKLK